MTGDNTLTREQLQLHADHIKTIVSSGIGTILIVVDPVIPIMSQKYGLIPNVLRPYQRVIYMGCDIQNGDIFLVDEDNDPIVVYGIDTLNFDIDIQATERMKKK